MKQERIPCSICGAQILPTTAEATGGRCMPCKKAGRGKLYTIQISGWQTGAKKITAAKAIRVFAGLDLAKAKSVVDRCLEGETVTVTVDGEQPAVDLVRALHDAAFDAELTWEGNNILELIGSYTPKAQDYVPPTLNPKAQQ